MINDNELLGLYAINNDQSAFEELIKRHAAMVMHVCRTFLWNQVDCEDAFQSVFVLLSRKSKKLMHHQCIGGWLHNVAVNISLTKRRSIQRQREVEFEHEPEATNPEPWQSISNAQQFEKLHLQIAKLPRTYREVIVLCHLNGLSRSQAANNLDTTTSAVKAALARARKMLRQRLIQQGIGLSTVLAFVNTAMAQTKTSSQYPHLLESTCSHISGCSSNLAPSPDSGFFQLVSTKGIASMPIGIVNVSLAAALGLVSLGAISLGLVTGNLYTTQAGTLVVQSDDPFAEEKIEFSNTTRIKQSSSPATTGLEKASGDAQSTALDNKLQQLEMDLTLAKSRFGEGHPSILSLQSQIQLLESMKSELESRSVEVTDRELAMAPEELRKSLATYLKLPEESLPKNALQHLSELQQLEYNLMIQRQQLGPEHPKVKRLTNWIEIKRRNESQNQSTTNVAQQIQLRIAATEHELQIARERFGPEHPTVQAVDAQLKFWKKFADHDTPEENTEKTV